MKQVTSRPKGDLRKYRDEMPLQQEILALLDQEPRSVNELAEALGWPNDEIMMYLMAMRRYGLVEELPKERRDRYFKYGIKKQAAGGQG